LVGRNGVGNYCGWFGLSEQFAWHCEQSARSSSGQNSMSISYPARVIESTVSARSDVPPPCSYLSRNPGWWCRKRPNRCSQNSAYALVWSRNLCQKSSTSGEG